ncbi:UDP-N-acetylmuramoyl-L-alanyl-D-glutamate--2,6-diaminopimelate ligase [Cytobacillus sp. IB215665]|uniref:UDP-N-acetylmuramoyl-L-alanyl-D-glutamate--2, 6-diaminopimelate ligase n=1 Tax=Cytobacillus sp. IB215665 TaxID=3097357 RepID=UPI002A0EF041|nr:UDP-N-acetylmuramoyl-L-alanyl-D-glutamate--2,6-diaminopimelate ligase [Cytobacillus sp. IB215665]MDX8366782.1 UDP-N-acetylmuramoyl-L-alanyl-D-glutamate--2,6-diaminopimelate ligase [Cytobacillus sp. IB215665]
MRLQEIASLFTIKRTEGNLETEITGLQMDSRKIVKGNLFICVPEIKGFLKDRHLFAKDAVKNGAAALIVEKDVEDVDVKIPKIFVKDARHALAIIASHFYNYPSHEMKLIGITGTNGKTTTSYIIDKILSDYNYTTGLMGNNGTKINGKVVPSDINTQEPPVLQHNLRRMRDCDTDYCVMEVTSQGLDMNRVLGCNFRTAIFTNLTQDHIDYHGTFEDYRNTKGLLFTRLGNTFNPNEKKYAILNANDPSYHYFRKIASSEVITYGINNDADISATNINMTSKGIHFHLATFKGEVDINLQLVGLFNVYNVLAAIAATLVEGIPLQSIKKSLSQLKSIDGRMEVIDEGQDYVVLVDYAHTPDALENVLTSIKDFATGRVITVFGCGGDRDTLKRPIMGNIASKYSDIVIITSDNPRSEDPHNIMTDINQGIIESPSLQYDNIVNREEAINQAIKIAAKNDVVLIAGKGHEKYQILKDKTIQLDDKDIARKAIIGKESKRT